MKMNIILQHQGEGQVLLPRCGLQDAQVTGGAAEGALQTAGSEGCGGIFGKKNISKFSNHRIFIDFS